MQGIHNLVQPIRRSGRLNLGFRHRQKQALIEGNL